MLSKNIISHYYDTFFKQYPQKASLSGVIDSLQRYNVSHMLSSMDSNFKEIHISKKYLLREEISKWSKLPEYLSVQDLKEINKCHGNNLHWKLLDSTVTDAQINKYKKQWNINLPKDFEIFLKSYANLLCEIEVFLEKGDLTPIRLELPLMLWGNEMFDFNINLDIEITQLLSELGYILIATKNGYEWWCLDSQSGEIVSYTDDDDYSDIEDCCNKEMLFERHGFVKFNSFNDFLQACFLPK